MNPAAAISRAANPPIHYVCGVQLRPYCIGHWLHLQREGVSFSTHAEFHTLGDLLLATLICSDTFDGFAGSLRRGGIERAVHRWHRRLSGGFSGIWKRRLKQAAFAICSRLPMLKRFRGHFLVSPDEVLGFNFERECEAFQRYLDDHGGGIYQLNDWAIPQTRHPKPSEAGVPMRAPELIAFADALITEGIATRAEVMDMPLPKVRWDWAVHAERKGWLEILNDEDLQESQTDQEAANDYAGRVARGEVAV